MSYETIRRLQVRQTTSAQELKDLVGGISMTAKVTIENGAIVVTEAANSSGGGWGGR